MTGPEDFYDERILDYDAMESWTVAMYKLAMKFARDYGDKRELEVRQELTK